MNKKILYPALTLLSFWFFTFGIPLDTYDANSTLITLIGTIVTTALLAMALFSFFALKKDEELKEDDNSGCFIAAGIIGFLFAFAIFLIYRTTDAKEKELVDNGKFAVATIIDGSSYKTRKADFTSLKAKYQLEDGSYWTTDLDISASEFENYYVGREVVIVYSPNYPSLANLLRDDTAIKRYARDSRDIKLQDLLQLYEFDSEEKTVEYLNTVNQKWSAETVGTQIGTYYNKVRNVAIRISEEEITYVYSRLDHKIFEDELLEDGYKATQSGKHTIYTNDKYMIIKRSEEVTDNNPSNIIGKKSLSVVSVIRQK